MNGPSAWSVLDGVDLPRGYRVEITAGKIIMTPHGEDRWKVVLAAAPQIEGQLAEHGDILSDVAIDFPSSEYGYAPDLAIVAPGSEHNSRGRYEWHSLEAVLEVVSKGSRDVDFAKKFHMYAECGIPVYVIIDPSQGMCTVRRRPTRIGTYEDEAEVPFGQDLVLPLTDGRQITINTGGFPKAG
ncbi:Uma2 family endonuclease [Streptomyces himalayensis]|uniref:Uma2 family endonuclease n=1 Tax=Streptomyces himalayensis subsp. himalayensis TaxID=2756131 RepID=A0A7W0IC91_9ACTN|nr:Uma2 family endonuclease [Streptomyces himalayensis]MBA2950390.1 Uma2 family endonuclease [Streptomyces himalayensis subsp. himalayensis]